MLQTLAERKFPATKVYALASSKSAGRELSYGEDDVVKVQALDSFDFSTADIALFSAGGETAKTFGSKAGDAGCIVIDNSSAFRMDDNVPLIVPEVNPGTVTDMLKQNGGRNIIANPNCSTAQLVVALKPLHDTYKVRRVVVSTYQATSGAGRPAMDELFNQTKGIFVVAPHPGAGFTARPTKRSDHATVPRLRERSFSRDSSPPDVSEAERFEVFPPQSLSSSFI